MLGAQPARAAGYAMFDGVRTGEKPQSKLFHHDGSWWTAVHGPSGIGIYEKQGNLWQLTTLLGGSGKTDVKISGNDLFVLAFSSDPELYKLAWDAVQRDWDLLPGFPVSVPQIQGAEALVLEQDSTGRLWYVGEGESLIQAYHSLASHLEWSNTPIILRTGVNEDDIASVVAFGGDKIGVFWSDQVRDEFGFRVHHDGDPLTQWDSAEVVSSGFRLADDHVNLAFDSNGRVYAVTKDDSDRVSVHRRTPGGTWSTAFDVLGGPANHPSVMVSEADGLVYVLYTDWNGAPLRISYCVSSMGSLVFGEPTTLISSAVSDVDDVSGTKQLLPAGNLIAIARGGGKTWWNGFGDPSGAALPSAPPSVFATHVDSLSQVELTWAPPASGTPDGYFVYRSEDEEPLERLTANPVTRLAFTDSTPPAGEVCYFIAALEGGFEGALSQPARVVVGPPNPPIDLTASLIQTPITRRSKERHELVPTDAAGSTEWDPHFARKDSRKPEPRSDPRAADALTLQTVTLVWAPAPLGVPPSGYHVYRSVASSGFVRLTQEPVSEPTYVDTEVPGDTLCYYVTAVGDEGEGDPSESACVSLPAAAVRVHEPARPRESIFLTAEPNPFNPHTRIRFRLAKSQRVRVGIYNVRGQRIATLAADRLDAGEHHVVWAGRTQHGVPAPSGAYFVILKTDSLREQHKIILLQ
ncbi:MAG: hypothetical protein JSW67_10770 [Candidatus Latescibacterota bacterium]|nr:MAG: hypothetical protein JSW67_10770 [Candidatus Latescibacterota bacterium]